MENPISKSKQAFNSNLPIWFADIEKINWKQFQYVYSDVVDVPLHFKIMLTGSELEAEKSWKSLLSEIEHQDYNQDCANLIIPFFVKILEDNARTIGVLECAAGGLSTLIGNIAWSVREEMNEPEDPNETTVVKLLWEFYPVILDLFKKENSLILRHDLTSTMISLIAYHKKYISNSDIPYFQETRIILFNFLDDNNCSEYFKTELIGHLVELAKYDLTILKSLRDWSKSKEDEIWIKRTVSFEISEFQNGLHATDEEKKLRQTLSISVANKSSKYLPHEESKKVWRAHIKKITSYETTLSLLPFLKRFLKPPY
jgi:hypothetical protein